MLKVLLVEDEPAVRLIIEKVMKREGFAVVSAETGEEACRTAQSHEDFDVAIVDCVLPGQIQGDQLVRCLRQSCPGIGVVQMSGYPKHVEEHVPENDFDRILSKPVSREDLLEALNYAYQARSIMRQNVT